MRWSETDETDEMIEMNELKLEYFLQLLYTRMLSVYYILDFLSHPLLYLSFAEDFLLILFIP